MIDRQRAATQHRSPRVTIAIPTLRRPEMISDAVQSVLAQTFPDFELLVVDNSRDGLTERALAQFRDPRIKYTRTPIELSVIDSWNRCIDISSGEYLHIFADDDRLHPTFLEHSVGVLDHNPSVGFTFSHANKTDISWNVLQLWGYDFPRAGLLSGRDYLRFTLEHTCCISLAPTVIVRRHVYDSVGRYHAQFGANTFDFNFYLRAALRYDTFFIDEVLLDYRLHAEQLTETHWRVPLAPTDKIGTYLELLGIAGQIVIMPESMSLEFVSDRIQYITSELTHLLRKPLPHL